MAEQNKNQNNQQKQTEEQVDPGIELFGNILKASKKIFENEELNKSFKELEKDLSPESMEVLKSIFSSTVPVVAFQAVVEYDEKLKIEIDSQIKLLSDYINKILADLRTIEPVMEVFKTRLGKLENQIKIDEFKKETNNEMGP